jgi:hypothetical protein
MVSPLMELCCEIYVGKPLGLVSFAAESRPSGAVTTLVLQRKFAKSGRNRGQGTGSANPAGNRPKWRQITQRLFCEPSLGKVSVGWLGREESIFVL